MALLSTADRTRILRALMRRWSNDRISCSVLKGQIYDPVANTGAIADCDGWIDGHSGITSADSVGFNGSLNVAYRSSLTTNQKTDLLLAVAAMRRGLDYVRRIFGETE